jgi:hypothetical protein
MLPIIVVIHSWVCAVWGYLSHCVISERYEEEEKQRKQRWQRRQMNHERNSKVSHVMTIEKNSRTVQFRSLRCLQLLCRFVGM